MKSCTVSFCFVLVLAEGKKAEARGLSETGPKAIKSLAPFTLLAQGGNVASLLRLTDL